MEISDLVFKPGRTCPKCRHRKVSTKYCEGDVMGLGRFGLTCETQGEHLHRGCERCGYEWLECCIDAKTEGNEAKGG